MPKYSGPINLYVMRSRVIDTIYNRVDISVNRRDRERVFSYWNIFVPLPRALYNRVF